MVNGGGKIHLNSAVFPNPSYNYADLTYVITHEMGHALGLSHSGDASSVMTYESHEWGVAACLSQDDVDGVIYLYPNKNA